MNEQRERIRERIRKLMAYAGDGAASAGEVENAIARASELIDKYHFEQEELDKAEKKAVSFARVKIVSEKEKLSAWERDLAKAIATLFGNVKYYVSQSVLEVRRENGIAQVKKDGSPELGIPIFFYGPEDDSTEAMEMFSEWAKFISTMGLIRYGSAFRGKGLDYACGFARALLEKVLVVDSKRQVAHDPGSAITIRAKYDQVILAAKNWLFEEHGVQLSGQAKVGVPRFASDAFAEGRSHGSIQNFQRQSQARQRRLE